MHVCMSVCLSVLGKITHCIKGQQLDVSQCQEVLSQKVYNDTTTEMVTAIDAQLTRMIYDDTWYMIYDIYNKYYVYIYILYV